MRTRTGFVTAVAVAAVLGMGGLAVSAGTPEDAVHTACVNDSNGALRMVDSSDDEGRSACTKREHLITWNAQGPVGPSGLAELAGLRCIDGEVLVGFTAAGGLDCEPVEAVGGGGPDDPGGPVDTDADGTPDAQDSCPAVPTEVRGNVSYPCPVTLVQLLDGQAELGADVYVRELLVRSVSGTVVTLTDQGSQQETLEPRTVEVDFAGFGVPEVGSRVTVFGVVIEAEGGRGLQLAAFDLTAVA